LAICRRVERVGRRAIDPASLAALFPRGSIARPVTEEGARRSSVARRTSHGGGRSEEERAEQHAKPARGRDRKEGASTLVFAHPPKLREMEMAESARCADAPKIKVVLKCATMASRAFLQVVIGGLIALGITGLACGDDTVEDGPRFGDPDGSFEGVDAGTPVDDASCVDAFPPCATIEDGGQGSDLDAPAEAPKDAGPTCDYPNTCSGATELEDLQADDLAATTTYQGTTSRWVGIRATEEDTGPRAHTMKVLAELEVPAGTNYDLYMYMDTTADVVSCSKLVKKGTGAGNSTETLEIQWGESGFWANGASDARPIRFEVRHVSGLCDPEAKWKLTISGNQ
jgi:hypothetical protein